MLASELIDELTSILRDTDLKKSAKENFEGAILTLRELGAERQLSGSNVRNFLNLNCLPTAEAGCFYEYKNTNPQVEEKKHTEEEKESVSEIFYLMEKEQVSCLHRLKTVETWKWKGGCDVILYIFSEGTVKIITLNEENPTHTISEGELFGAMNLDPTSFGLVICECKPGFLLDHYSGPTSEELVKLLQHYSGNKEIIDILKKLT